MGIGVGIFLIAVGSILKFALKIQLQGVDLQIIGVILMIVGVLGLALEAVIMTRRHRRRPTVYADDADRF